MRAEMQLLTWVGGSFAARVLAARLESEGIDVELRGAIDGPYGLTVGDMARVDVFVPTDQMEDAKLVLLADAVDAAFDDPPRSPAAPPARWPMWMALVVLVAAVAAPVLRYLVQ